MSNLFAKVAKNWYLCVANDRDNVQMDITLVDASGEER